MANGNAAPAPVVEPRAGVSAPVEPTTEQPASDGATLPDELLQIPAMQAVFAGSPPAVSAPIEEFSKRPEAQLITKNKDGLMRAGLAMYRSLGGDIGVIFNQLRLSGAQVKAADQAGRLQEIAPPFDAVNQQVGSAGESNPVLSAQPPTGLAGSPVPEPPQSGSPVRSPVPPQPASSQRTTNSARLRNLTMGGPSTGPKPGAGRILNSILKPAI